MDKDTEVQRGEGRREEGEGQDRGGSPISTTSAENPRMTEMGGPAGSRESLVFLLRQGALSCSRSHGESPTE